MSSFLHSGQELMLTVNAIVHRCKLADIGSILQCRIEVEQARLLVLEAADQLDRLGNKTARGIIAMAKVKSRAG